MGTYTQSSALSGVGNIGQKCTSRRCAKSLWDQKFLNLRNSNVCHHVKKRLPLVPDLNYRHHRVLFLSVHFEYYLLLPLISFFREIFSFRFFLLKLLHTDPMRATHRPILYFFMWSSECYLVRRMYTNDKPLH